jgi:hypothetical protein
MISAARKVGVDFIVNALTRRAAGEHHPLFESLDHPPGGSRKGAAGAREATAATHTTPPGT